MRAPKANVYCERLVGTIRRECLEGISISVGLLTEAYISYGWLGATGIMALVGVFLSGVNTVLLSRDAGVLMKGIGLGLLPAFIGPESQMAQFVGGFLQQVLLVMVVMLPIVHVRVRRATQGDASRRRERAFAPGPIGGQSVSSPPVTR